MGVNGVIATSFDIPKTYKTNQKETKDTTHREISKDSPAVSFEKSTEKGNKKVVYKQDTATLIRLKADAEKRARQLRDLVEKTLLKQGQRFNESTMYQLLREGKISVDDETAALAKEEISEDGYWGVKQTSDRLVSFAKALTGGDPDKADMMIEAIKKGFEQATKAWGGDLPDICKQTLETAISKLEEWKKSATSDASYK
ncbi:MAG: DUF5610 domain-containing protein [Lachnoclostridium sp.]|jgi:hypothetical protein